VYPGIADGAEELRDERSLMIVCMLIAMLLAQGRFSVVPGQTLLRPKRMGSSFRPKRVAYFRDLFGDWSARLFEAARSREIMFIARDSQLNRPAG
jgi:hypothetical protein